MSPRDFWESTPAEFAAAMTAWHAAEETRERGAWERMRILAAITVQPHCKKRLSARRLVPLPWDGKNTPGNRSRPTKEELEAEWRAMKGG